MQSEITGVIVLVTTWLYLEQEGVQWELLDELVKEGALKVGYKLVFCFVYRAPTDFLIQF